MDMGHVEVVMLAVGAGVAITAAISHLVMGREECQNSLNRSFLKLAICTTQVLPVMGLVG